MAKYLQRRAYDPVTGEKTQNAIIECGKCGEPLELYPQFTITCECGADYNLSGQRLADRSQWGEETGETWEDCI